ncbi:MAG: hypothetical protein E7080_07130 [Bacteroidales bacterium]|nr:hypothetical protein [Bacteroidales bacterium]
MIDIQNNNIIHYIITFNIDTEEDNQCFACGSDVVLGTDTNNKMFQDLIFLLLESYARFKKLQANKNLESNVANNIHLFISNNGKIDELYYMETVKF